MVTDPFLKLDEVCEELGVTLRRLRGWIELERIESVKLVGQVRIRRSALDRFIESHTRKVRTIRSSRQLV